MPERSKIEIENVPLTIDGAAEPIPVALDTIKTAKYTGLSESFFKKARVDGHLPGKTPSPPWLKIGKKVLYKIEDLDLWLNQHRQGC